MNEKIIDKEILEKESSHKYYGIEFNQLVWSLLSKGDRSAEEDELMIHAAHTSHFHWLKCGTKVNEQRGEWLISRVYSVLNVPERAMFHAQRCKEITDEHLREMKDFDIAYANEVMARAFACNGNAAEAKRYFNAAKENGEKIADNEGKEMFMGDLNSEPWFGIILVVPANH